MNKQVFSPVRICIQPQKVGKLSGAAAGPSSATSNLRLLLSTAARLQWQPTRHRRRTRRQHPQSCQENIHFWSADAQHVAVGAEGSRKGTEGMQSGGVCFSFRMKVKHLCLLLLGGCSIFVWSVHRGRQRKTLQQEISFCCKHHILEPWEGSTFTPLVFHPVFSNSFWCFPHPGCLHLIMTGCTLRPPPSTLTPSRKGFCQCYIWTASPAAA